MKKAIVMEVKDSHAAVLCEDGTFRKIRKKCKVGDEIMVSDLPRIIYSAAFRRMTAAAAVIVMLFSTGFYLTVPACSYVSLDADPSIEFSLNRLNRVVSVNAINDEGRQIRDELMRDFRPNAPLSKTLGRADELMAQHGYRGKEDTYYLVNISSDNEKRRERIHDEVDRALQHPEDDKFTMIINGSDLKDHHRAREHGISAGRFEEIRKINGFKPDDRDFGPKMDDAIRERRHDHIHDLLIDAGDVPPPPPDAPLDENGNPAPPPDGEEGKERPSLPSDEQDGEKMQPSETPDRGGNQSSDEQNGGKMQPPDMPDRDGNQSFDGQQSDKMQPPDMQPPDRLDIDGTQLPEKPDNDRNKATYNSI